MSEDESQKHIEDLKKSKKVFGEFTEIIIDFDGEILSGIHRTRAGWEKISKIDTRKIAEDLGVTVPIAKELVRLNANIQRKISNEERTASFTKIANELVKSGMPKESIVPKLTKLLPFSERYIYYLIPDEFKRDYVLSDKSEQVQISTSVPKPEFDVPKQSEPLQIQNTQPKAESNTTLQSEQVQIGLSTEKSHFIELLKTDGTDSLKSEQTNTQTKESEWHCPYCGVPDDPSFRNIPLSIKAKLREEHQICCFKNPNRKESKSKNNNEREKINLDKQTHPKNDKSDFSSREEQYLKDLIKLEKEIKEFAMKYYDLILGMHLNSEHDRLINYLKGVPFMIFSSS